MFDFNFLKKSSVSAAELRTALKSLSVADAERKVTELEAARRKALLDGTDADVERIEREITAANRGVERVAAAIEELTMRIADAEKRELDVEINARHSENLVLWDEWRKEWLGLIDSLDVLMNLIEQHAATIGKFKANNQFVIDKGRPDLKMNAPIAAVCQQLGRDIQSFSWFTSLQIPGPFARQVDDCALIEALKTLKPNA